MILPKQKYSCIILAGGEGKRVGGADKGLLELNNKKLIEHVINVLKPQVNEIIISANRNIKTYENYGYKVVPDRANHYQGPLAGIAAALPYCNNEWVFIAPCDMPRLPADIIDRLAAGTLTGNLCIAEIDARLQLLLLLNKKLYTSITHTLKNKQLRLMQWVKSQAPQIIPFPQNAALKNFNTKNDFTAAAIEAIDHNNEPPQKK